ncbi:pyridoxal phosphate phosphatase PHOSPHO2 [Drosophila hydei]|uniref:Pyridoxal phosphate phosphatase PHOSPHO2 n=1 Tax=Drosophila hydei TaxID=7224 RepID=A0A6J1LYB2_DROHY|nr:pyridoxal phosphate phosphatase PHOSPHO2 [Drosophila hydei]
MLFGSLIRSPTLWRCFGSRSKHRVLVTFDFDKTIIDEDSYVALLRLLAPEYHRKKQLQSLINDSRWLEYLERVLHLLQRKQHLSAAQIAKSVRKLKPVPGILNLLRRLEHNKVVDMCILSDANSFFITEWLAAYDLDCTFQAGVYTNPVCVHPESQHLVVMPYEHQTHCDYCPENLCKGGVMDMLIMSKSNGDKTYSSFIYVGDSCNDLCAIRRLGTSDIACVRWGEELHDNLSVYRKELKCQLIHWRDGYELEEQLLAMHHQLHL